MSSASSREGESAIWGRSHRSRGLARGNNVFAVGAAALSRGKYYLEGVVLPNSLVGFPGLGRGGRIHIQLLAEILVPGIHRVLNIVRLPHRSAP